MPADSNIAKGQVELVTLKPEGVKESVRRQIVAVAGFSIVVASLLVCMGWQFGISWLLTPIPGGTDLVPNASLLFLLLAVSLWVQRPGTPAGWRHTLARSIAWVAVALSLLFILEYLTNADFSFDSLFLRHALGRQSDSRPAVNTALATLMLGLSLAVTGRKWGRWYLSEIFFIPGLFIGYLGLVGYALGARVLFREFPAFSPVSVYSALFTCVIALGIAFLNPDHHISRVLLGREIGSVVARRLLFIEIGILLLLGFLDVVVSLSGAIDVHLGTALLVASGTCLLAVAVLWTAAILNQDVIARRRAEQAVRYLSAMVESSEDAIVGRNLKGIINSWNKSAERLYGYSAAEVLGNSMDILIPKGHKNELPEVTEKIVRGEHVGQYECKRVTKSGTVLDMSVRMSPIVNDVGEVIGISGIARDITENKRTEAELRAAKEEWEQTFNNVPDLIAILDRNNRIVRMNNAMARRLHKNAEDCIGQTCFSCVHGSESPPSACPHARTLMDGKLHIGEVHEDRLGGDFVVSTSPLYNEQGEMLGVVHVARDITEQKRAEAALVRSEKLATTGRMAATIAHEIHNPLDAVGNLLYLIHADTREETTRNFVAMATKELERVTQMTQQMLTFQREAVAPVPVNIAEVLENVVALFERKIQSAGITIERKIEGECRILAMPGEIRQVFANLVGNAIEAMPQSGGRICLRVRETREWRGGKKGIRVSVFDNGPGIPPGLKKEIFEPFFTTKGESGTGLGLWITASIVAKFGGTLHAWSRTSGARTGTCFSVFFPCK